MKGGDLMAVEAATLYKLMLLYILNKVDFEMTNTQLTEFILERQYTSYFQIQTALSELVEEDLCRNKKIRNSTYYKITDMGRKTLHFFKNDISETIRQEIDDYLKENEYELREESSVRADYLRESKEKYLVRCTIKENNSSLLDLTVSVTSEQEAKLVCSHWEKKSTEIYGFIMKALLE